MYYNAITINNCQYFPRDFVTYKILSEISVSFLQQVKWIEVLLVYR